MSAAEIWREVPGYVGMYSASDFGRVKSHARPVPHWRGGVSIRSERILAQRANRHGYPQLNLYRDGEPWTIKVANLVMLAFKGPAPGGMEVCHDDGIRANSALRNLRYDTPRSNAADRVRHGTHSAGERNGRAKLSHLQAMSIRVDRRSGPIIAAEYRVTRQLVNMIRRGDAWRTDHLSVTEERRAFEIRAEEWADQRADERIERDTRSKS